MHCLRLNVVKCLKHKYSSHENCLRSESGLCSDAEVWVLVGGVAPASKAVDSRAAACATRVDVRFTGRGVARRKSRPWCARVGWPPPAPRRGGDVTSTAKPTAT